MREFLLVFIDDASIADSVIRIATIGFNGSDDHSRIDEDDATTGTTHVLGCHETDRSCQQEEYQEESFHIRVVRIWCK